MSAEPERVSVDELRSLFLFEQLSDDQLAWLQEHGYQERRDAGTMVYVEGDPATCLFVVLEGTVTLLRRVQGDDLEVTRTDAPGVYGGATQAYLGDAVPQRYMNSLRAITPVRLFVLSATDFTSAMRSWFPMAVHLLEGLFFGLQSSNAITGQRERLLALGSLTAGLTHELNNPAAAAVRATASLRTRVAAMRQKLVYLASAEIDHASLATLIALQDAVVAKLPDAPTLSPIEEGDREDEITDWLEAHGVHDSWEVAPVLVQGGVDPECLDEVAAQLDPTLVPSGVRWIAYTVEAELLMAEIEDSVNRMSRLVSSAREYSQLDRTPHHSVDVRELLDATLVMMSGQIGPDITVVKDYDPSLPPVPCYPAELNQVFTNLIDNAISAMEGSGTLTVRTRRDDDHACIAIGDTGQGVPDEIRPRIFEPFFTTKPVGQGTGLGLDISYRIVVNRHRGDLILDSRPSDTWFTVRLPLEDHTIISG